MALTVKTEFALDCPRATAWAFLTDAARAVPCFPGAELGEVNDDGSHAGSFGVKLGPMSLKFAGRFTVTPIDAALGTLNVRATGLDNKGRGSANADVHCTLAEAEGRTRITVLSNVELTGSIAQFGRAAGMIEVLSKQLLLRFASNVEKSLASEVVQAPSPEAEQAAAPDQPVATPVVATAAPDRATEDGAGASGFWVKFRSWLAGWFRRR